uniref:Uncharacterized protein n=1 Tax=Panagrolaimus sp. JU765 TaxID=591449 RepID=A0AC34Q543_9BILA
MVPGIFVVLFITFVVIFIGCKAKKKEISYHGIAPYHVEELDATLHGIGTMEDVKGVTFDRNQQAVKLQESSKGSSNNTSRK